MKEIQTQNAWAYHSAKGQAWTAVTVLNGVDGCIPSDMATGTAEEIEEERRLLYVAMSRAKDDLDLMMPQRVYVTHQGGFGGRHVYASRTRFIPNALLPHFEQCSASDSDQAIRPPGIRRWIWPRGCGKYGSSPTAPSWE